MQKMPILFIGHGSPMYVIEDNPYRKEWHRIRDRIPKPKAILCISAHWYGEGQAVCAVKQPRTIHDFYGFPKALYQIQYPAPGAPELASRVVELFFGQASLDNEWGLDHGAWSVLSAIFPKADIPVCQLSVNALLSSEQSYQAGHKLQPLRKEGVLIIASGNIVHNLGMIDWKKTNGFGWADEFDTYIKNAVEQHKHEQVIHYQQNHASYNAFTSIEYSCPIL